MAHEMALVTEDAGGVAARVQGGWALWEAEGKPVSVRLSLDVVSRLGMAVQEGFRALRRRGLETGGLLIGTKTEAGNRTVVDVTDFEPIDSEHANGPSYQLSEADCHTLEERIAAREAAGECASIVGFYRSHTRPDFSITAEDTALFSTYFRNASDVFLLIKSNDEGPPTGGFIIREEGQIQSESPYAQFPFDWKAGIRSTRETRVLDVTTPRAPRPVARIAPFPTGPRTNHMVAWPVRLTAAAGAALAVALTVGLSVGLLRYAPGPTPAVPPRSLALSVAAAGDSLRLSWDHQAISHAGIGVLWIKDGQEEQRFELDAKQLSEGSVAYWPTDRDVTFRLELASGGGTKFTESVRAIGGPSHPSLALPASLPAALPAPTVTAPSAEVRAPKRPRTNRTGSGSRQGSRTFAVARPEPDLARLSPAPLPEPPANRPVVAPALEHSKEFLQPIVPDESSDGSDSSYRVRVEPVAGSRLARLGRSIPVIGKRYQRADYVPPAPRHNPGLTSAPHRNVSRDVNIDVKVYVNPSGKVEYSEVLSKVASADRDLATSALFSARDWEFVPARAGEDPVPGEVILHYQFGPGVR
jgi:hypothetical protein